MTAFEEYFTGIADGRITACEKMKLAADMLLEKYYNPGKYHFDEDIASRHIEFIERFCKQPSGKIGQPLRLQLFQRARFQAIFGFVDDNNLRQYNEALIIEGRKNGKALSLDTDIPTLTGWKKMRDICVGDKVFGSDGKAHAVTLVSEVFKNHDCYKVVFEDHSEIICDADHLWTVKNKKAKVVTKRTKDLLHYKRERRDKKGIEYLYRVPMGQPVEYEPTDLPIDPYTFGIWLGDGSCRDPRITCGYEDLDETAANISSFGHSVKIQHYKNRASNIAIDTGDSPQPNPFTAGLRALGVLGNKHIPDVYLQSSVDQRLLLLQGLMDTDGFCSKAGECEFAQKNKAIVFQFIELLASLGIKGEMWKRTVVCNGKECESYRVFFFTDKTMPCFRLKRKYDRLKERLSDRMKYKSIVSISPVESVDCKCITIDSEDHLYCAGRSYSLTHNTTETAAVEIDMLVNDHEGAPQIYNLATMLDQAKLGFNAAHKMVKQSPALSKHIRKRAADLYFAPNMGFIKALASNTNSLDGLDVHCGVIDELAAIKSRDLYDLIKQAMGARSQPLLFTITTNGFVRDSIFDAQYEYASGVLDGTIEDEHFLPFVYELDNITEWDKEECWEKANPGLGTIKSFDYLRQMVSKAKMDPTFKPTVMVKDFNMRQTGESAWLRWEDLDNTELIPDDRFRYCIGGFDAADTTDLNAAKAIFMRPDDPHIYVKSMYWLPQKALDEFYNKGRRQGRDNAPYDLWQSQGLLRTVDSYKVDKKVILEWFREVVEQDDIYVMYIGYDPWHIDDSLLREFKYEFGEKSMIPVRQGVLTLSQPMKELKADLQAGLIVYNNNPIDKWCLANTAIKVDINGNIQPIKGLDERNRIDGTMALIDAYVVLKDKYDEYQSLI